MSYYTCAEHLACCHRPLISGLPHCTMLDGSRCTMHVLDTRYHDVRTLQHIPSDTVTRLRRSLSCILAMVGHASVAIAAHALLPAARSRQLTAAVKAGRASFRAVCWSVVRLTLGTARLYAGMGVLSAATEWHLPLLCLRPVRSALDDPFASTSVAEFWYLSHSYPMLLFHCVLVMLV